MKLKILTNKQTIALLELVLGTSLGVGNTAVNKKSSHSQGIYLSLVGRDRSIGIKQTN